MADEPKKQTSSSDTIAGEARGSMDPEEHAELRARSSVARANAQAVAARCLELRVKFEASVAEQARWRESLTRMLPELRESVSRYVRCLKAEGAAPEQMLVLVKEALHQALMSSAVASSAILDMSVGCAIEAYYEQTAA